MRKSFSFQLRPTSHWHGVRAPKDHSKKSLTHPQADKAKRTKFIEQLQTYGQINRPIIYLDESGFKSNDYRPYTYASRGQKCADIYNW